MTSNLNLTYVTQRALKLACDTERKNISRYWRDNYSSNSALSSHSTKAGEQVTRGLFQVLWTQESGPKKSIGWNVNSRGVGVKRLHVAGYWPSDCWPFRVIFSNISLPSQGLRIIDYLITRKNYVSRARGLKKSSKYAETQQLPETV